MKLLVTKYIYNHIDEASEVLTRFACDRNCYSSIDKVVGKIISEIYYDDLSKKLQIDYQDLRLKIH